MLVHVIDAWETYPEDVFPRLWLPLSGAMKDGVVVLPSYADEEINCGLLKPWLKEYGRVTGVTQELIWRHMKTLGEVPEYSEFFAKVTARPYADLWIVSRALELSDADDGPVQIVTHERWQRGEWFVSGRKKQTEPRLPAVADRFDVSCSTFAGMLRLAGWTFQ
jgi:hypothetical protein